MLFEIFSEKFRLMSNIQRKHWIFDISPIANSKSRYEVCRECTEAVWIVFRNRLRG